MSSCRGRHGALRGRFSYLHTDHNRFSRSILVLFGSYVFWTLVGGARPTKTRHSQLFLLKAASSLPGELVALYRSGYPQSGLLEAMKLAASAVRYCRELELSQLFPAVPDCIGCKEV